MPDSINPESWDLMKRTLADLARRVAALEQQGGPLPAAPDAEPQAPPAPRIAAATPSHDVAPAVDRPTPPAALPPVVSPQPRAAEVRRPGYNAREAPAAAAPVSLEKLIGGRWFTWLGAGLLALAVAFFVPWAWRHFQLPPWVRVLVFHLTGLALLAGAYVLQRRRLPVLAHGLAGLGIFTLYAAAFAMEYFYKLWGASGSYATLVDCALITAAAIVIAVRYSSVYVILLGALGGYVTPLISARGAEGFTATFVYLAFLNVALLATATVRPWRFLKPIAVAATAVMFLMWFADARPSLDAWRVERMLLLHAVLFLAGLTIPPIVFNVRSQSADLVALAGNSLWFVACTWLIFHRHVDQQLALVCWAMSALHAALFAWTYTRLTNADRMPRFHLALAATFFTLAVPLQLRDSISYLAYAWAVQGFVFTAIGVYFGDRQMRASGAVVLVLAALRAGLFDFMASPELVGSSSLDRRCLVMLGVGIAMIAAGSCAWWAPRIGADLAGAPSVRREGGMLAGVGNLLLMLALTRQWDSRLVLFLWTLDAAVLWAAAFRLRDQSLRTYALFISLALVGGRALYHGDDLAGPFTLLLNQRFVSLALVALLYLRAGWFERNCRLATADAAPTYVRDGSNDWHVGSLLHLCGNAVMLVAISMEIRDWWQSSSGAGQATWAGSSMEERLTYSVVWAAYAALLVAAGFMLKYRLPRLLGLAGILAIAGKVVFFDLAELPLIYRVLVLAALGALMLVTSFWYQKFTARLDSADQ